MTPLRILIVDDDRDLAQSLGILLEIEGYEVTQASSGEEAVEKSAGRTFDLVILDFRLPGMCGVDCFHELRRLDPRVEVLSMTAYDITALTARAVEGGARGVLDKPLDVDELTAMLETLQHGAILTSDDAPDVVGRVTDTLSGAGYSVLAARDAGEIAAATRERIDVLVFDSQCAVQRAPQAFADAEGWRGASATVIVSKPARESRGGDRARVRSIAECFAGPFDPESLLRAVKARLEAPAAGGRAMDAYPKPTTAVRTRERAPGKEMP